MSIGALASLVIEILKNCGVLGPQILVHHLSVTPGV